tara:strand:+ start:6768 stop:7682 length:915 start_codon:yes stop_codon:yes gene_type:complete
MWILAVVAVSISCEAKNEENDDITDILKIISYPDRENDFSLWQLEGRNHVQMAYIIRTDDSKIIVIDGGLPESEDTLTQYLKQLNGVVDTWIVTHPHIDHAGALLKIIPKKQIKIKRILHVKLQEEWVKLYEASSLDFFNQYNNVVNHSQIPLIDVEVGETFLLGKGVIMKVLGARNDIVTKNAINNSSMAFKISGQSKSVLFLGDLGIEGGNAILNRTSLEELQADYVQMSHHGQNGVDKIFYESVKAKYALWPTPVWLWDNNLDNKGVNSGKWNTVVVREWMTELKIIKNYVVGLEGTVQID